MILLLFISLFFIAPTQAEEIAPCDRVMSKLNTYRLYGYQAKELMENWRKSGKSYEEMEVILARLPPLPDSATEMRRASYAKALEILSQDRRPSFSEGPLSAADRVVLALIYRENQYQNWFIRTFLPTLPDLMLRKDIRAATQEKPLEKVLRDWSSDQYVHLSDGLLKFSSAEDLSIRIDGEIGKLRAESQTVGFFRRWVLSNAVARLEALRSVIVKGNQPTGWWQRGWDWMYRGTVVDAAFNLKRLRTLIVLMGIGTLMANADTIYQVIIDTFAVEKPVGPIPRTPLDEVPIDPDWQKKAADGTLFD